MSHYESNPPLADYLVRMVRLIGKTMIYYLDIFSKRSIFSLER